MDNNMKRILRKIDKIFCAYLGLDANEVLPSYVTIKENRLIVSNTESFKRHFYTQNWNEFNSINFKQLSQKNKEKLGIAIGKAIAKNLVISFEEITIKMEKTDA